MRTAPTDQGARDARERPAVRPAAVVKRDSDITRAAFSFELLHTRGAARNMNAFHWHDFMEIDLVRAGAGTWEIEDAAFPVAAGDVVIVHAGDRHRVRYDPASPLHETVLHFSPDLLALEPQGRGARTLRLPADGRRIFPPHPSLDEAGRRAVRRLVGEIRAEWETRGPWFETLIRARLVEIACLLLRAGGREVPDTTTASSTRRRVLARLDAILSWLRSNYRQPLRLDDAARHFDMRPSYFSYFFHRNLGVTFTAYLAHLRVREAARLIEETAAGSAEAAFASGFSTRAAFYRAFHREMGASPGEWLRGRPHGRPASNGARHPAKDR